MGFRFRKSFKIGPARMTFSKSGVSKSIGTKGVRITRTAKGKTKTTVSLPKTGLSYTSESGGRKTRSASRASRSKYHSSSHAVKSGGVSVDTRKNSQTVRRPSNPPKPPKSAKIYLTCGIILLVLGFLMLFLFWPVGLLTFILGAYYAICGPKIYTKLVEDYKAVHPEFEENEE